MSRYQNNGFFELRREQLCSEETFPQMKLYQRRWLYDMIQGYKRYGEKAILAFDLCRILAVAQMGFMTGHLSMEEALHHCWKAAIVLQASFSSWEEMCDSFLRGYAFHTQQDKDELPAVLLSGCTFWKRCSRLPRKNLLLQKVRLRFIGTFYWKRHSDFKGNRTF